jgi:hypothetical protein
MDIQTSKIQTAAHRVLFTTELLEAILLELPYRDLLVNAQRVCVYFHHTINASVALQQALFFVPCSTQYTLQRNPLLFTQSWSDYMDRRIPRSRASNGTPGAFYPWHNNLDFTAVDWSEYQKIRGPYGRPEASWRRMFVSQPPVTVLEADVKSGFWGLKCSTGLTMDMLERNWMVDWTGFIVGSGRPKLSVVVNASPFTKHRWW